MINWKELEKFILPGKVVTLVIMVDGKEMGAFSFNVDSLAYKEILETKEPEPVKIADKDPEKKEAQPAVQVVATTTKKKSTKKSKPEPAKPAPNPEDEEIDEEEENDDLENEDGEEKAPDTPTTEHRPETWVDKKEKEVAQDMVKQQVDTAMAGSPTRMTRDAVMTGNNPSNAAVPGDLFAQGTTPAPEKKPDAPAPESPKPTINDEW